MKTKMVSLIALFLIGITVVSAQTKTETVKVYGNCGMCENRIENAATAVQGVFSADWDKEEKELSVSFDSTKTDAHKIQMAIAKAGHDTQMHKASDADYNHLPGCCQYDRPKQTKAMPTEEHKSMNMEHKHNH